MIEGWWWPLVGIAGGVVASWLDEWPSVSFRAIKEAKR